MTFVDLALEAIREVADEDSHIGNYLDRDLVDSSTIIRFASTHPGYPHWRWCVAITGDEAHASVNEVWMEPGDGALRIPEWKPWSERIRPGDLGAGDVVETDPKDPRLTAGYTGIADVDGAEAPERACDRRRLRLLQGLGVLLSGLEQCLRTRQTCFKFADLLCLALRARVGEFLLGTVHAGSERRGGVVRERLTGGIGLAPLLLLEFAYRGLNLA